MPLDNRKLENLLTGELDTSQMISSGSQQIGNLTSSRINRLLSKFATTGLGRTGIGGSALNNIYGQAGQSLTNLESGAASKRSDIIGKLMKLYEYKQTEKARKDSQIGFGDVVGGVLGLFGGSALGGLGAGAGSKLTELLGLGGGGGSLHIPSIENL